ncbi:MAG: hypothetical protein JNM18_09090 [Planctomycetaceae bacterium]|nr:hypothetical protein [Planctomycetaceae bacterium]
MPLVYDHHPRRTWFSHTFCRVATLTLTLVAASARAAEPLTIDESQAFMRQLAQYVFEHHLKQVDSSPQRGIVYEYYDVTRAGQPDRFVQGEALDTMHDGAWLLAALVQAERVTGDKFYRQFVTEWTLPFYLKMLNHSDTLFNSRQNHARPERQKLWRESKEWLLQDGEKGFVPYWWDDGYSVSLEQRIDKKGPAFPSFDHFTADGRPNPECRLSGYSFGSSNHLAQDLGVMLESAYLWLRDAQSETDRKLLAEVVEAAKNLQQCRLNHHGNIPAVVAPVGLATGDARLLAAIPDWSKLADPFTRNHYVQCLSPLKPGQRMITAGFADDDEYHYFAALARHAGQPPRQLAFRLIYDAFTQPQVYAMYCDETPARPGINRFDLHPYAFKDGKPEDYQSDRKGPGGRPKPAGSRMGPQNMVVCGWALQLLAEYPGVWDERRSKFATDAQVVFDSPAPSVIKIEGATLQLSSSQKELRIDGQVAELPTTLKLFAQPDAAGSHAIVQLTNTSVSTISNDQGAKLSGEVAVSSVNGRHTFRLQLPYSWVKGQQPWANAYEHGRLSVQIGAAIKNVYFASGEATVKAALERELGEGLSTWRTIFAEKGYIPTCLGGGSFGGGYQLDNLSDTGGYAHLISAAAQWITYRRGEKDWQRMFATK